MALLSAYHEQQITGTEAVALMNSYGLSQAAQTEMVSVYNLLVAGTVTRSQLDNALQLGEAQGPGFSNEQEFLSKLGLG